jgi:hypothetical protein
MRVSCFWANSLKSLISRGGSTQGRKAAFRQKPSVEGEGSFSQNCRQPGQKISKIAKKTWFCSGYCLVMNFSREFEQHASN